MRLGIMVSTLLLLGSALHAEQKDSYSNSYPAFWRSSRTATVDGFAMMGGTTPCPIILHSVFVEHGVAGSTVAFYGSTTAINDFSLQRTTTVLVNTSVTNDQYFFDVPFSTGMVYKRIGNPSTINIFWNYISKCMNVISPIPYIAYP